MKREWVSKMTIKTRLMTRDDIDDVVKISGESFSTTEGWNSSSLEHELINHLSHCFVITKDNSICGFATMWIVYGEANINSIAIAKDYRDQGLGSILIKDMMQYCIENKTNIMTLEVRGSNLRALHVYEKLGFVVEGERLNYYQSNGESAILMGKRGLI